MQDTVRAPSTHFGRIGPGDQMAGTCLFPWLSCALGLPRREFLIHLLLGFSEGTQMGSVPVRMVKGLSDPLIPLRFPDITTHDTTDHHTLQGLAHLGPWLPGHFAPI